MKKIYEVKTLEEAKKLAEKDFGSSFAEVTFEIIKETKGFLGFGGKLEVCAELKVNAAQKGKEYIEMILNFNGAEGTVEVTETTEEEKVIKYDIDAGDYNGYLIGKNSRNLIALQTLVSLVVNECLEEDQHATVLVDVGNYRKRREKTIENMAVEWGKEVARTKVAIRITDLNAYERKVIHNKLSTWRDVQTHSEGEQHERVLIIEPKNMRGE